MTQKLSQENDLLKMRAEMNINDLAGQLAPFGDYAKWSKPLSQLRLMIDALLDRVEELENSEEKD